MTIIDYIEAVEKRVGNVPLDALPWIFEKTGRTHHGTDIYTVYESCKTVNICDGQIREHAELIANAPTDLSRLTAALRLAVKALEKYTCTSCDIKEDIDCIGYKACIAMKEIEHTLGDE